MSDQWHNLLKTAQNFKQLNLTQHCFKRWFSHLDELINVVERFTCI